MLVVHPTLTDEDMLGIRRVVTTVLAEAADESWSSRTGPACSFGRESSAGVVLHATSIRRDEHDFRLYDQEHRACVG